MLVITVALAGTAFALVGTVSALWQLYLFVSILGGVGMSSFYLLTAATVTHWFDDRRGLALALALVGFSLGYIIAGPIAASLITRVGWRAAYALLGGGCGAITLLAALTVRLPRPSDGLRARAATPSQHATATAGPNVTLRAALVDPRQWYLNGSWLLLGGVALMISVHVVPFARDQGISLTGASLTLTAYGLGSVVGRLASGAVSDRLGTFVTIRAGYTIQIVALLTLWLVPSRDAVLTSLVVFGIGFAAADTMVTKVIPDVFGVRAIGAIMGVLALGWRAGAALGPAAAGFLYDATSSYTIPFAAAPVAVLTSWGLFALATRR
jgi:MFS transporter, OFA family, oxalate/formate antiporter